MKYSLNLALSALVGLMSIVMARADYSYSNAVISLAPVAYWPLDETSQPPLPGNLATNLGTSGSAYDGYYGSGSATGTTGALVGDADTAASFNGTSGYLDIPYGPAATINAPFTVEAWLNAQGNTSGTFCALSSGQFGSPRAGWLIYNVGTGWSFRLYDLNGTAFSLNLTAGTVDSNWHHIVAVYDGVNGYLYEDGALVAGPTAASGYVANPNVDLAIGARSDGGFVFNGSIDEVAIYTNVLSASDVLAHYQNGVNPTPPQSYSSLVLAKHPEFYYRLDETISTPISTVLATNYGNLGAAVDGTYLPGTQPAVPGPNGMGFGSTSYACNFIPATSGYVDCGLDADLGITTAMSVVAWFKGAPADSRFQSFLGRSDNSWRADLDPDFAHFADGSSPDAVGSTFVNDGNWHFFAGVYDGTNAYLYIDGVADATNNGTGVVLNDSGARMVIGGVGDYIPGRLFKGSVAQVAVFTNYLTASQVQALYYAGELAPTITQEPQPLTIGLGDTGSLTAVVKGNPTLVYQWYQGTTKLGDVAGNISGSTNATLTIIDAQSANGGNYTVVITNSYGSITSTVALLTITPSPDINREPTSNTLVYAGNQVSLVSSAIGAAPLSFQWYQGATPINGATATNLTLTAVAGTNLYRLVVTNTYGAATSSVATVVGQTFVAPAYGFTVNFDAVANGDVSQNFVGQGAYGDSGHNAWNPIGGSGVPTGLAFNSASNQTLVTATLIYGFNNTGIGNGQVNGDPSWLLSTEDAVNSGSPGIGTSLAPEGQLTVNDLPQGAYTVYLYSGNYDGNRGAIFNVAPANGGGADQGINATANAQAGLNGSDTTVFAEGDNYVIFTNVVADAAGNITITYVPNDANPNILHGEAPFDGVQLVLAVRPVLTIHVSGTSVTISWNPAGGTLQSATSVAGPYSDVIGANSPYPTTLSGTQQYFRVKQ